MFKTVTLAAIVASAASIASADSNYIVDFAGTRAQSSIVDLQTVRADSDGVVEIYNYHGGETGALLGSQNVFAGANDDVRVNLGTYAQDDVLAVLKVNGQVVDTQEIDFR